MNLPALKCKNRRLFNITGIPAFFITIFLLTAVSCGQSPEEKSFVDYPVLTEENEYPELTDIKAIFYDLYSPVKAHRLFQQINVVFDPDILNPVDNVFRYSSSNKIALNLGIYGADMSFCHMFGQTQEAINYMSAVYRLSERLGIAGNIITEAENARKSTIYNPDSLFNIASNIYIAADRQLKESGREGAASLILAGGWIEAFYIACSFYDKENPDSNLEEQILTQKYSLDRLTAMLSNHQNNEYIAKYLLMIRQLQHKYDSVEILFGQDDLIIDTTKKTIESDKPKFVYTATDIEEIIRLVTLIRQEMVN